MKVFGLLVVLCTSLASGVKDGSSGTPGPEAKGNTFAPSQNMTTITSPAASDTPASTTSPAPTTIAPAIPITAITVLAPAMPNTTTLAPGGTTVEASTVPAGRQKILCAKSSGVSKQKCNAVKIKGVPQCYWKAVGTAGNGECKPKDLSKQTTKTAPKTTTTITATTKGKVAPKTTTTITTTKVAPKPTTPKAAPGGSGGSGIIDDDDSSSGGSGVEPPSPSPPSSSTATPKPAASTSTTATTVGPNAANITTTAAANTTTTSTTTSTVTTVTTVTTTSTVTTVTTVTTSTGTTTTTVTATCTAGQYLDVAINLCQGCPDNEYQDEAVGHSFTKCMAWKDCVAAEGQVEKDAPSASRQRTCWAAPGKACSTKPLSMQYENYSEEHGPAASGDDGSGGSGAFMPAKKRLICAFTEECPEGHAVELKATDISDVVCTSCKLVDEGRAFSNTLNAQECTPWKTCGVDEYWEQPSGSTTTDIKCSACPAGQYQPLQNERKKSCGYTTAPPSITTTQTYPTDPGFGPGGDNSGPGGSNSSTGNNTAVDPASSGISIYMLIGISCGGTILLLIIGMLINRKCRRKASYLTASAWSNASANRSWQGGFEDDNDDEELLGGM